MLSPIFICITIKLHGTEVQFITKKLCELLLERQSMLSLWTCLCQ